MSRRFLSSPCLLHRIGHLAMEPDFLLKARALGFLPADGFAISTQGQTVVNPCLLDYWRQYLDVTDAPAEGLIDSYPGNLQVDIGGVPQGQWRSRDIVQGAWEREGRLPLLTLTTEHWARGWATLAALGVPVFAWFVALDVREAGYLGSGYHDHRNADVLTYLPAIDRIRARGGWVIRIGHPSTQPLPPLEGVLDYAHSALRSDWMDIFLLGDCRFLLGTNSGPICVSGAFGRPVCGTNWTPISMGALTGADLFIPKRYAQAGRVLSCQDVFASPARTFNDSAEYRAAGLTVIDNTAEEIAAVTDEMLDRLEGIDVVTDTDRRDRARYHALLTREDSWGTLSTPGRAFLRAAFAPELEAVA